MLLTIVRDVRSEKLSTVDKLYYFPVDGVISGEEVALGRFPLTFLTDERLLTTPVVWKSTKRMCGRV